MLSYNVARRDLMAPILLHFLVIIIIMYFTLTIKKITRRTIGAKGFNLLQERVNKKD